MNYKRLCHNRLCRVLICLVLICCLIAQTVPARANAAGFVPGLYDIAANIGVNAALRAIGVGPGNSPDVFNQLVTDATNNLFEGLSPLTQVFLDYTANGFRAFLSADFLARALSYLFSSGTLSSGISDPIVSSYPGIDSWLDWATKYPYWGVIRLSYKPDPSIYEVCVFRGNSEFRLDTSDHRIENSDSSYGYVYSSSKSASSFTERSGYYSYNDYYYEVVSFQSFTGTLDITSNFDLTLDSVGESLSSPVYSDWTAGAITQEDQTFVPVSIPSISDSAAIFTQTQAQAQAGTIPETVVDEIVAGAESVPDSGSLTLSDVVASITAIPKAIGDVISNVLTSAFAVSDTFIATKVNDLTNKYPYLDVFFALGADLKSFFFSLGTKPPIIYLDLGAADGLIPWGEDRVKFLDLTWYSAYKPVMDSILGGFLWLWLAWRIFLTIPGLINGTSGVAGRMISFNVVSSKKDGGDNV